MTNGTSRFSSSLSSSLSSSYAAVVLFAAATAAHAQRPVEPTGPHFHKLASIDSANVRGAALSPNGRWLMVDEGDGGLWIAAAGGRGKAARLLSPGYTDASATWFLSSDKLAFVSNRASREGANKLFVTTVSVDPATGAAVGTPRQVSTEPVNSIGRPSPDGQWIPYVTTDQRTLKLVPATGGTARTVAQGKGIRPPILWSTDGKTVYFPAGAGPFTPAATWFKVGAAGGAVTALKPGIIPHFPNPEQHLRLTYGSAADLGGVRRVELLDANDRVLGVIDVPAGMSYFPTIGGALGLANASVFRNHLVNVATATERVVAGSDTVWADGWTADGTGFVADGGPPGRQFIAVLDTMGHLGSPVMLPADARAEGWEGVVGSATTFRRGAAKPHEVSPLYAADARTGTIRELSPHAQQIANFISGRGGEPQDADRFIVGERTASARDLKAVTLDGHSELLRTFNLTDTLAAIAVHGQRVAWVRRMGDSLILSVANEVNGPAKRVFAWRAVRPSIELAWSRDGSHLAALGSTSPTLSGDRVTIRTWRFEQDGSVAGTVTEMHPNLAGGWSTRWVDGDRALALIATLVGTEKEHIYLLPLAPPNQVKLITPEGESEDEWFQVSPDGRHIVYPESKGIGSTIWRMDFAPAHDAASNRKSKP